MKFFRTERFKKDYKHLPIEVRQKLGSSLEKFLSNPRHPSLHVKKMEGTESIWEMRLSDNYRITFEMIPEGILLRRVRTHNVLRQP